MPRSVDPSEITTGSGSASPGTVSQSAIGPGIGPVTSALDSHLSDPSNAHRASAISIQDIFSRYISGDVEGALGELAALVPPSPGGIGSAGPPWLGAANSGVPDWGILKLWDGALPLSTENAARAIYPYYWRSPVSVADLGIDPITDETYNVEDGANIYTGGGDGLAHSGFVTMSMGGGAADGYPSWRILPTIPLSVGGDIGCVVSGIVSPADRGVVALVRWEAGDTSVPAAAVTSADVLDRCPAALLLGLGLADGGAGCDGDPGGIFVEGTTPYVFPGRASGQYNLDEIHGTTPAAGQVRLLTNPAAGITPVAGGLPILGATSIATGGGTDGNFFAYRLPYLKDYSEGTGLIYTPLAERARFFTSILPAATSETEQAGDYANFTENFWAIQIGRYRHRFTIATGAAGALRRDASYALVHFRREEFFEAFVRDGVVPTDAQVYSVNLISWSGAAQVPNLADSLGDVSAPAMVNRAEITEDPTAATPAFVSGNLVIGFGTAPAVMVSGIGYYVPRDPLFVEGSASTWNVGITRITNLQISGVFNEAYRSHDRVPTTGVLFGDPRGAAINQNTAFLSLGSFSFEGTESFSTPQSTISLGGVLMEAALFPGGLGQVRRSRIEFGFADLRGGATDPAPADNAVLNTPAFSLATGIRFEGDQFSPVFTEDARARLFIRRPLALDGTTGYPLPADPVDGFEVPFSVANKILYHSMKDIPLSSIIPAYGNAYDPTTISLYDLRDREELFLDELYRYPVGWEPLTTTQPLVAAQLIGPGLPGGLSPVLVPVRPVLGDPDYPGYYFGGYTTRLLDGTDPVIGDTEAQVAGLPYRNPPYTDGVTSPLPSRGILIYPQDDYSTGYNPVGADYSVATGDRAFVRAFDAGATNAGSTSITLKLWGVTLADYAFTGAGPGNSMALMVKVPGLTTWMDVGRSDGSGPSKQDPLLDGAGCRVIGPNSFDEVDAASQIATSQVEVNLGPMAPLFMNSEGRCPVLIKVIMKDSVAGKALNWRNVASSAATADCRGLVGVELVLPE